MANVSTAKMSSKGQVLIPENIRRNLNLKAGSQFIVLGEKDVVIHKNITPSSIDEFDELISKALREGKKVGLKKLGIVEAIKKARGRENL